MNINKVSMRDEWKGSERNELRRTLKNASVARLKLMFYS